MTDKELLKLAAKAAGINTARCLQFADGAFDWPGKVGRWNPLTDDGDALRLVVKLKLQLQIVGMYDDETGCYDLGEIEVFEKHGSDPYAATRSAIVRAAAEIGKGMK
jgi:hypothetical protein